MLWLLACGEGVQSVEDTAAETVVEETELSYQFTIAILADPHVSGTPEHTARLEDAITWINEHAEDRQIDENSSDF